MMKSKRKGGKKVKDGQPKQPQVNAFDLEFINKNDLKKYVNLLEKELALMRKDSAFYNSNKEKIMEFLESRRNVLKTQNEMTVVRQSEKDEMVELMRRFPEKYNEKLLLADKERLRKKLDDIFHDFLVRSTIQEKHFDEEHFLKSQIDFKDKRIDSDQFLSKMTMMDLKEAFQSAQEDIDLKHSKQLESLLHQNISRCLRANKEFSLSKTRMLISVWDIQDKNGVMRQSYIDEMKRMQGFFQEISSSNNEVIKILRERLAGLLTELKKVTFKLKQVRIQNAKLQVAQPMRDLSLTPDKVSHVKNVQRERVLENLKFKNEILQEQLRMEKENFQNLKKQLINAIRKIHQKAGFKAHILEELIKMNLQMETIPQVRKMPSVQKSESVTRDQKLEKKDGLVNLFSIRVEDSDTLFVPPHYDEYWDLSILLNN